MGVNKSKSAFRSIAEVTEDLDIAPHVLRFLETKFPQIKPMKTKSSRRYYRPDDVAILELIKDLLYVRRYTIEGVQKLFKNRSVKDILGTELLQDLFEEEAPKSEDSTAIKDILQATIKELTTIKEDLQKLTQA